MTIEGSYVTDRGRRRRRSVRIDLDEVRRGLDAPGAEDLDVWRQIRSELQRRVGASTFDIWLDPIKLIAVDSERRLVIAAPAATAGWTSKRFGPLLSAIASQVSRDLRFANEAERHAFSAGPPSDPIRSDHKEAAG